jgi:hypothetical protein
MLDLERILPQRLSPDLCNWIADSVIRNDTSVKSVFLVDDNGKVLSHRVTGSTLDGLDDIEDRSLALAVPSLNMTAFLRYDSSSNRAAVWEKATKIFTSPRLPRI